jgi:hypothetical protein
VDFAGKNLEVKVKTLLKNRYFSTETLPVAMQRKKAV